MNKKRKILTVVALAVFGAIIAFHYGSIDFGHPAYTTTSWHYENSSVTKGATVVHHPAILPYVSSDPGIKDVRMPLFVLAVFYVGLFSILGNKKRDSQ